MTNKQKKTTFLPPKILQNVNDMLTEIRQGVN